MEVLSEGDPGVCEKREGCMVFSVRRLAFSGVQASPRRGQCLEWEHPLPYLSS